MCVYVYTYTYYYAYGQYYTILQIQILYSCIIINTIVNYVFTLCMYIYIYYVIYIYAPLHEFMVKTCQNQVSGAVGCRMLLRRPAKISSHPWLLIYCTHPMFLGIESG